MTLTTITQAVQDFAQHPAVERLGWALLHFVWQGAIVAALLAVALACLRKRPPGARYAAACAALMVLAWLPVATFVLAPLPTAQHATRAAALPPVLSPVSDAPVADAGDPRPHPAPAAGSLLGDAPAAPPAVAAPPAMPPSHAPADPGGEARPPGASLSPWHRLTALPPAVRPALPWCVAIWCAGVVALALWHAGGWLLARRLARRDTRPLGPAWEQRLSDLCRRLGVRRTVRLLESARATVPIVVGWLRPVVLVPCAVLNGLTPQQLEAILAHELAHIRRHDYAVNLLQAVIETLLFYHPAVWWVSARVRREREDCCDDAATAAACNGDAVACARALAALEGLRSQPPAFTPSPALAATRGGDLLRRVRRLLNAGGRPPCGRRPVAAALAASVVVVGVIGIGATYTAVSARPAARDGATRVSQPPLRSDGAGQSLQSVEGTSQDELRAALREQYATVADYRKLLRDLELELKQAEGMKDRPDPWPLEEIARVSPEMSALLAAKAELEGKVRVASERYIPNHQGLTVLRQQLETANDQVEKRAAAWRKRYAGYVTTPQGQVKLIPANLDDMRDKFHRVRQAYEEEVAAARRLALQVGESPADPPSQRDTDSSVPAAERRGGPTTRASALSADEIAGTDARMRELVSERDGLKRDLARVQRAGYGEDHADVVRIKQELGDVSQRIETHAAAVNGRRAREAVREHQSGTYYIGGVPRAGAFDLSPDRPVNLLQALIAAGLDLEANQEKTVVVIRREPGEGGKPRETVLTAQVGQVLDRTAEKIVLRPDDVVMVRAQPPRPAPAAAKGEKVWLADLGASRNNKVGGVLDLDAGRVAVAPGEANFDRGADLALGEQGHGLILLNGAKATVTGPGDQPPLRPIWTAANGSTGYALPDLPADLRVTTADGGTFNVSLISIDGQPQTTGGVSLYLQYEQVGQPAAGVQPAPGGAAAPPAAAADPTEAKSKAFEQAFQEHFRKLFGALKADDAGAALSAATDLQKFLNDALRELPNLVRDEAKLKRDRAQFDRIIDALDRVRRALEAGDVESAKTVLEKSMDVSFGRRESRREQQQGRAGEPQAAEELYRQLVQRADPAMRLRAITQLTRMLAEGQPGERATALSVLPRVADVPFNRAGLLPRVRELLKDASPAVRAAAVAALPSVGGGKADVAALLALADDKGPAVRSAVPWALYAVTGEEPGPEVLAAVEKLLSDYAPEVQTSAIRSLWGRPVSPAAEAKLIELSRGSLSGGPGATAYDAIYYALSTRPVVSPAVADRLIEIMGDPAVSADVRGRASWGLSHHTIAPFARERVTKAFLKELDETLDPYVRSNAAYGLGQLGGDAAVAKLKELAEKDENPRVRKDAAEALKRLGH